MIGNEWRNILYGGGGSGIDKIYQDGASYDGTDSFHANDANRPGPNADSNLSGSDIALGGEGDDTLYGGLGSDILHGGFVEADLDGIDSNWDTATQFAGVSDIAYGDDGTDTADYSKLDQAGTLAYGAGAYAIAYQTMDEGVALVEKGGHAYASGQDTLFSIEKVIGTENYDTFYVRHEMSAAEPLVLAGGASKDVYLVDVSTAAGIIQVDDTDIRMAGIYGTSGKYINGHATTVGGVTYYDIDISTSAVASPYLTLRLPASGAGIDGFLVDSFEYYTPAIVWYLNNNAGPMTMASFKSGIDVYAYGAGTNAAGGTTAEFDGSGDAISQKVKPSIGGSPISSSVAEVIYHPFVITSFSQNQSGGAYNSTLALQNWEKEFNFVPTITMNDIRLTAGSTQGDASLTISVDSLSYSMTVADFETGRTISGLNIYDQNLHTSIGLASSANLTNNSTHSYSGSYASASGLTFTSSSVSVTYYLEKLNFIIGGTMDLAASLTFTGTSGNETLYGLDTRADTIRGVAGNDTIYAYGGNDILYGGAGNDTMYGALGDDGYYIETGFGTDTVIENASQGTDTIRFVGIDPADVRLYTDSSGHLKLVQISAPSNIVTANAGITGSNTSESTIGTRIEGVTFDATYATTWDLTGGLTITGSSSNESLYGTAYGDTIYGLAGVETIYGNAGNDTIYGGTGNDTMYGATGDDAYRIESSFGTDSVIENASQGTDTIRFVGIDPADVRLYTDSSGHLKLVQISAPSNIVTANAGITGNNTSESTIGTRIESVTFDSGYGTTWDLTGGLTITGSSSNESLYGTAYGDTIYALGGTDTIYGNAGNDTIYGGGGTDTMYGATGDDAYRIESSFGTDTVIENASQGTDTIRFVGIDPADVRLYTDSSGHLKLVQISAPSNIVTANAGITGNNTSESTIGTRVESVTFDSGYSTTWDLTGGLTITGSSSNESLYGTAYGDTIYGLAGTDTIYANAGNDTIYGGSGADTIYGGPGDDAFRFETGFGADGVSENASQGTDTVRFVGIAPSDVRLYTDSSGHLHLVQISDTSNNITVYAGVTGSNTAESTIGTRVESVTFDSGYSTTWDLTGGLTITGTSGTDSLYGTGYGDTIYGLAGTDTLYGNDGNDTVSGGDGADTIYGGPGNDILYGDGGADSLSGGTGVDTFMFLAASALGASDTIADFNTGQGDRIDISDVISAYDPLTHLITDWVQITTSGSNSLLKVDIDGTANGTSWTQIASITGVTGLTDEAALVSSGNLLA